jgi:hypothetical protein
MTSNLCSPRAFTMSFTTDPLPDKRKTTLGSAIAAFGGASRDPGQDAFSGVVAAVPPVGRSVRVAGCYGSHHDAPVLDPFTCGPAVTNAGVGFAALLYNVRRNRRNDDAAQSTATAELLEGHIGFQQAAVAVLYRLSYVSATGLPPSWSGVLWTWPASCRMTRDFPMAIESQQRAFSAAAMTGPDDLLDPSSAVFDAIGKSCSTFVARGAGKATFDERMKEAYEELGPYTAELRRRLGGTDD